MKTANAEQLVDYLVEGCGPDRTITASCPEEAAQIAADAQHEQRVGLTWIGQGPDSALAEYEIRGGVGEGIDRVVVRRSRNSA